MRDAAPPTEETLDAFAERAVAASEAAADVPGVRACVHPHYDSALETPADLARFDDLAGGLPLALDTAHLHLGGFDLPEAVARLADRTAHVHLKDAVAPAARDEWPAATRELGAGAVPLEPCLDALADAGYDGWLVVEQDRAADPAAEAARSREFLSERGY
jgi:inosose dehydratase